MKIFRKAILVLFFAAVPGLITTTLFSQEKGISIIVKPYLQDATPHSITVMWETNHGEESVVEWGPTQQLGETAEGYAFDINFSESRAHEVEITGLDRFTTYYYRVKTGDARSDIYQFKTPPFAEDNESFRLVAMSDMQYDSRNPDKFAEIVQDGVLAYLEDEFGGEVPDNLALVMVPGDLVVTGSVYEQWQEQFFAPASELIARVPVYPVLGNHERNSIFYLKYFSLPENGTPAYAEHWWYKDYGNVRIIGLDSNHGYDNLSDQKDWLKKILDETAGEDHVDFVFAQLHHPHKSELWLAGESDFTGEVVEMLENFTESSGKPSLHFFGHTHGYSRGQSRDHQHLWINVASAGGRIDEWGAYAQENYDEFSITEAEYGFVMVEVDPNDGDPMFTVKRISRGNEQMAKDNELSDTVTVFRISKKPETPSILGPKGGTVSYREVMLKAGTFQGAREKAFHAASHWQVSEDPDFATGVSESWRQYKDIYFDQDLQKDDDLKDEHFIEVRPGKKYYWRVRYRDQFLNWSDWSEVGRFETTE